MTRPFIPFTKMEGAGNDFVVFAARELREAIGDPPAGFWSRVCDRRRGVGGDGVLVLDPGADGELAVQYRNRDGSAAFCGNGNRCAAILARRRGWIGDETTLIVEGNRLSARIGPDGRASVQMPGPEEGPTAIAFTGLDEPLHGHRVSVGVPHVVVSVAGLDGALLGIWGPALRAHPAAGPDGANANLFEEDADGEIRMRTWERGVEAETLACGTGAVAVALVSALAGNPDGPASSADWERTVRTRGGDRLCVSHRAGQLWLEGPARVTFEGKWQDRETPGTDR